MPLALNPIAAKGLTGKVGSMQILLLTAMTLFGFYLCFKELRRLSVEFASFKDRMLTSGGSDKKPARPRDVSHPEPVPVQQPPVVVISEDSAMDAMDAGLREMLSKLNGDVMHHQTADVEELDEDTEAAEDVVDDVAENGVDRVSEETEKPLESLSKGELEAKLRDSGIPFKKSDPKAKLVELLSSNPVEDEIAIPPATPAETEA